MAKNRILDDGITKSYLKKKRIEKLLKVATPLAAVVVFCVTYWLILPATAMQKQLICEKEEHVHTEECYQVEIIPGHYEYEEIEVEDITSDEVSDSESNEDIIAEYGIEFLDIENVESEDAGFTNVNFLSSSDESNDEVSTHTETVEIWVPEQEVRTLICGKEEHVHDDSCYDAEANEESPYHCGYDYEHEHDDSCYYEDGTLKCTLTEHIHTKDCLDTEIEETYFEAAEVETATPSNAEMPLDTLVEGEDVHEVVSDGLVFVTYEDQGDSYLLIANVVDENPADYDWQWQYSDHGTDPWIDIENANGMTLTISKDSDLAVSFVRLAGRLVKPTGFLKSKKISTASEYVPVTEFEDTFVEDTVVEIEEVAEVIETNDTDEEYDTADYDDFEDSEGLFAMAAPMIESVEEVEGFETIFDTEEFYTNDFEVEEISVTDIENEYIYEDNDPVEEIYLAENDTPENDGENGFIFSNAVFMLGTPAPKERPSQPTDPVDTLTVSGVKDTGKQESSITRTDNKKVYYTAISDKSTSEIEDLFAGDNGEDGKIATDKSVVYGTDDYGAFTTYTEDEFSVTLSALGQQYLETNTIKKTTPIDVVLVLDVSGSMTNKDGTDKRFEVVTKAANTLIYRMMKLNPNNRIGISVFSGTSDVDDNDSYVGFLPLSRYKVTDSDDINTQYLIIDSKNNKISTNANLKNKKGETVKNSVSVVGGTYTQAGMYNSYEVFNEGIKNEGKNEEVTPVVILISDGVPTYDSVNYTNPTVSSRECDGRERVSAKNARHGYFTILTANHVKSMINQLYYGDETTKYRATFYTVGMGVSPTDTSDNYMRAVLNPTKENINALRDSDVREKALKEYLKNTTATTVEGQKVIPNPYSGNENYSNGGFFRENYDAGIMTDLLINVVLENMGAYEYNSSLSLNSAGDEGNIVLRDKIGSGMEVKGAPVLHFNDIGTADAAGSNHEPVSSSTSGNVTTYTYAGTVSTKEGIELKLEGGEICIDEYGEGYNIFGNSGDSNRKVKEQGTGASDIIDGKYYFYDDRTGIKKFYYTITDAVDATRYYMDLPDRAYYYNSGDSNVYFKEVSDINYHDENGRQVKFDKDGSKGYPGHFYVELDDGTIQSIIKSDYIYQVNSDGRIYHKEDGQEYYDIPELGTIYYINGSNERCYDEELSAIRFTYYKYDGVTAKVANKTEVEWTIPGMILPEAVKASYLQTSVRTSRKYIDWYYKQLPIRLIYQVGLTEASKTAVKALGDSATMVFYTNGQGNNDVTASFTVGSSNPYFESAAASKSDTKVNNATGTKANYKVENVTKNTNTTTVIDVLGNNGKITYAVNPPITVGAKIPVEKVWEDGEAHSSDTVEITLYRNGVKCNSTYTTTNPITLSSSTGWKGEFDIKTKSTGDIFTVKETKINDVVVENSLYEYEISTKQFNTARHWENVTQWPNETGTTLSNHKYRIGREIEGVFYAYGNGDGSTITAYSYLDEGETDPNNTQWHTHNRQTWVLSRSGSNYYLTAVSTSGEYLTTSGSSAATSSSQTALTVVSTSSGLRLASQTGGKYRYFTIGNGTTGYTDTSSDSAPTNAVIVQELIPASSYEGFVITNTKKDTITIPVKKAWSSDVSDSQKSAVTVQLYKYAKKTDGSYEYQKVQNGTNDYTVTLNSTGSWSGQFENLPLLVSDEKYLISETPITGFKAYYDGTTETFKIGSDTITAFVVEFNSDNKLDIPVTITNKPYGKIEVKKNYVDPEGHQITSGTLPAIEIGLYKTKTEGSEKILVKVRDNITLQSSSSWKGTFENLEPLDEGEVYYIREENRPDGYTLSYSTDLYSTDYVYTDASGEHSEMITVAEAPFKTGTAVSVTVTNKLDSITFKVKKNWEGNPQNEILVDVYLVNKGSKSGTIATGKVSGGERKELKDISITNADSWVKEFELNRPEDGYEYYVVEHSVDGYITTYTTASKTIFIGEGDNSKAIMAGQVKLEDGKVGVDTDGNAVVIKNAAGSELPMTGGIGTAPIYALGLLLLSGLLFLL